MHSCVDSACLGILAKFGLPVRELNKSGLVGIALLSVHHANVVIEVGGVKPVDGYRALSGVKRRPEIAQRP